MFEKLSQQSIKIIMFAQEEARNFDSPFVETEHILLGILRESNSVAFRFLTEKEITYQTVKEKLDLERVNIIPQKSKFEIQFSPYTRQAIDLAIEEVEKLKEQLVEPEHLLLGIVNLGEGFAISILRDAGLNLNRMRWNIIRLRDNKGESEEISYPALTSFTTDLTLKLEEKEINSIIGRKEVIEEVIHHLNLYNRLYPLLVGKNGVGKTSIAIGVTQYILEGKIYAEMQNFRVIEFDFNNLLAESINEEEISKNFKSIIFELKQIKDIILVIDNVEVVLQEIFVKSGVLAGFMQLLKSNIFHCIGIMNNISYENFQYSALSKFFQKIEIHESNNLETRMFLEHWRETLSKYYNIEIDGSAISSIVNSAKAYYPDKALPTSAFQLLEVAISKKKFIRAVAQARIKDMERHLRILRHQRDSYLNKNNPEMLEEIKKEAQVYEEEIKILTVNISSTSRATLTAGDVQLLLVKRNNEEELS